MTQDRRTPISAPPTTDLVAGIGRVLSQTQTEDPQAPENGSSREAILTAIKQRVESIAASIELTTRNNAEEVERAIAVFSEWMLASSIVRVIGAGRARLAGSIPANRLAHGGARVYIQDDIIPMPHTVRGGGILAVSASGQTPSVLQVLEVAKRKKARVRTVGIASASAKNFADLCDIFIGIERTKARNPLQALADTEEYIISMLLDAMVVAAGQLAGFDDTRWRLGHEDLGSTGPYDTEFAGFIDLAVTFDLHKMK